MRGVSEETRKLLEQLDSLQRDRSWTGSKSRAAQTVALLERIAEAGEIGSLSVIARSLFAASVDVRKAACQAIHRILAPLSPVDLLHMSGVSGRSWSEYPADAWDRLQPAEVARLTADSSYRSTLLGLLSFHGNGYVRHEAVRQLAATHDGSELPYLLIRQNDWVEPISADARAAIRSRLNDENLPTFLPSLPLVIHLMKFRRRDHTAMVHRMIEMLLPPGRDAALRQVLQSPDREVRRKVCRMALHLEGEHQPRVVAHGLGSTDAVVR